jgi:hypothetical protein
MRVSVTQEMHTADNDRLWGQRTLSLAHSVHLQSRGNGHCRSRPCLEEMRTVDA